MNPNIDIDSLVQEVSALETEVDSIIALVEGFADRVTAAVTKALKEDANVDQTSIDAANAAIQAEVARIQGKRQEIADAVLANTPSES